MADERKPLEYIGYVIDRGIPFDGVQKAVDFYDGVGILDLEVIAATAPYWFDRNAAGQIVAVHTNAVSIQAFVDYWEGMGCKVTPISENEAREIRAALAAHEWVDSKYLKTAADTRKVAGGAPPKGAPSIPSADSTRDDAPASKKRGRG